MYRPAAGTSSTNTSVVNSALELDTSGPQSSGNRDQRTPDSSVGQAMGLRRRYPTYVYNNLTLPYRPCLNKKMCVSCYTYLTSGYIGNTQKGTANTHVPFEYSVY